MINWALCDSFFAHGDSFISLHLVMVSLHVVMVCKTNLEIWLFQDWVSDSFQVCFKTLIVMFLFSDLRVELDWYSTVSRNVLLNMFQNMPNWKTCQARQKCVDQNVQVKHTRIKVKFSWRKVYWSKFGSYFVEKFTNLSNCNW